MQRCRRSARRRVQGDKVITAMGGLGRDFDGGYAECTCPPADQVIKVDTNVGWDVLGAVPELFQTAWGSLFKALNVHRGERLLIRGGTSSVGLAACAIAKDTGLAVYGTTRNPEKEAMLKKSGFDAVFIDDGAIAPRLRDALPDGFDKVLELVGTTTLLDSLECTKPGSIVCMTGILGNSWVLNAFNPMESIPKGVCLTSYGGGAVDVKNTPYADLLLKIEAGKLEVGIGRCFFLDDIVEAHRLMDSNTAGGKFVILT